MPVRQGCVLSVQVVAHASGTSRQHNAGVTFLRLDSVTEFSPTGGTAVITGYDDIGEITEQLTYRTVDRTNNFMILEGATVNAYPPGADVVGTGESTYATVDLEDGYEPVNAEVSHSLKTSTVLQEGVRERSDVERVLIDEISGRWMLVEVIGRKNLLDGAAIDPETEIPAAAVPAPAPKAKPESSPPITVVPASRSLNIYAGGAQPDIFTTLHYEVALDAGFTTIIDSQRTRSTAITFAPTPDRTDLYVRATAENVLGSADPSATVGPVRTMLIEQVDVADFALTVKKFFSNSHQLY
jgi:hypothetical protein